DTVLLNDSTRRCNRLLHCGISMRLLAQCKSTCNLRWSLRPRCICPMMAFTKWGNENRSFQQNQWSEPIKRQRGLGNELIARAIAECKRRGSLRSANPSLLQIFREHDKLFLANACNPLAECKYIQHVL